jgi:putative ABC transport system ATP-binding protein
MSGPNLSPAHLVAHNVSKTFELPGDQVQALHQVTAEITEGEFIAILGSSGTGKSTLLHLLGGLDYPSSGSISIRGTDLSSLSERDLTLFRRSNLGFVFQSFNLLPTLTVFDNIAIPYLVLGRRGKEEEDRVADIVELFGLRGRERRLASQLSMGEQQRVAIARAILTQPALVIADEPTGNVDSTTGLEILQMLWESCDNFGQTVVMATHHPRLAAFADRVLILHDGSLIGELHLGRRDNHANAQPILDYLQTLGL